MLSDAQTLPERPSFYVFLEHSKSKKYPKQVKLSNGAAVKGNTIIPIFLFILANGQVDTVWFTEEHDLR